MYVLANHVPFRTDDGVCKITIRTTGPEPGYSDTWSWGRMWEVAVALVGVCVREGKMGVQTGLGEWGLVRAVGHGCGVWFCCCLFVFFLGGGLGGGFWGGCLSGFFGGVFFPFFFFFFFCFFFFFLKKTGDYEVKG